MRAAEPEIANAGHRVFGQGWGSVCSFLFLGINQECIDFARIETRKGQVEIRLAQLLQFQREQLVIPRRPVHRPVDRQTKCFDLRRRPLVAEDYRDLVDAQLASRFDP
jgi:hypothetical protein